MTGDGMEAISDFCSLDEVIQKVYGESISVTEKRRVSGGDINEAYLLQLSDGESVFLKENARENIGFFSAEVEGLKALASTKTIGVPTAHAYGTYGNKSFLLMESLKPAPMVRDFWERFGHALADMHKADTTALLPEKNSRIMEF